MKFTKVPGKGNEYLRRPYGSDVIWVCRFKKGFKRIEQSLGTNNTIEARAKRDDLFLQLLGEGKKISKKVKQPCVEVWPVFRQTKNSKSQQTKDSIDNSWKHLEPFIGLMFPEDVNEAWWTSTYIPAKLADREGRKFFNDRKWLQSFLNFCWRNGLMERLPKLEDPDGDRELGLNLSDEEIKALYDNSSDDLKLQIDLGFRHFMRRSEVLLLPWSEIDFAAGAIKLPKERTKIRKAREIPLSRDVLEKLEARKEYSESAFVFPSPRNMTKPVGRQGNKTAWRAAIERANEGAIRVNPGATFHDLRHSGLSRAFLATNRYIEICLVAGLSYQEAQRTYIHANPDQTRFVTSLIPTMTKDDKL